MPRGNIVEIPAARQGARSRRELEEMVAAVVEWAELLTLLAYEQLQVWGTLVSVGDDPARLARTVRQAMSS